MIKTNRQSYVVGVFGIAIMVIASACGSKSTVDTEQAPVTAAPTGTMDISTAPTGSGGEECRAGFGQNYELIHFYFTQNNCPSGICVTGDQVTNYFNYYCLNDPQAVAVRNQVLAELSGAPVDAEPIPEPVDSSALSPWTCNTSCECVDDRGNSIGVSTVANSHPHLQKQMISSTELRNLSHPITVNNSLTPMCAVAIRFNVGAGASGTPLHQFYLNSQALGTARFNTYTDVYFRMPGWNYKLIHGHTTATVQRKEGFLGDTIVRQVEVLGFPVSTE